MKHKHILLLGIILIFLGFSIGYNSQKTINISPQCYTDLQPQNYFKTEQYYTNYDGNWLILNPANEKIIVDKSFSLFQAESTGSMYPSIGDNSILIVKNVSKENIKIGDVVIVDGMSHRVIRITGEGFNTKGDNNRVEDIFLRNFSNIQGKVVGVLY